jgi:TRAP-type C4-dicarboxylate transport system permease small subunit
MKKFAEIISRINEVMMWIVGALIMIMGILLFYDVMMRYFFNNPTVWSFDLTSWFTGMAAFLGGGYTLLKKGHVRVDIFYEKFSLRTRSAIDAVTSVFLFLIVIVFIWKGTEQVIHNYQINAVANTGLDIHVWIKWLMVPIGGLLLGLQALVNLINDISTAVKTKEPERRDSDPWMRESLR